MPEYRVTVIRRADARPDMPISELVMTLTAESEELAEMMIDSAVVALTGLGQMDINEIYETGHV
jgi:hypothetical protein